ncbi:hypothetical protein M9H77_36001 [Catharanthus roseus]|uniref:Uncharacterized protein n=1 Tax=Catharanthus roseus TaxID=4058 RepID=A0ACB9ZRV5_CATRO|nr:hypothetical protein M9H77_36001 [Catharanthus roseus]
MALSAELSNVINSLNTLFENVFGFQFCHLHFKEILLKDFETQMETILSFQKFFDRLVFKEKNRSFWNVGSFMFTCSHLILCNTTGEKRYFYAKESEFIEAIEKGDGLSPLKEMEHQIEWIKLEGFEEQGKAFKLLSICLISKDHSREQKENNFGAKNGKKAKTSENGENEDTSTKEGDLLPTVGPRVTKTMPT